MNDALANPAEQSAPGLLSAYPRTNGAYDEMLAADGGLKPHYAGLIGTLEEFSPEELRLRWETCQRFVHEQGITYNVYGDPRGMERPWQLDLIPLVIAPAEWRFLEAAAADHRVNRPVRQTSNRALNRKSWFSVFRKWRTESRFFFDARMCFSKCGLAKFAPRSYDRP